MDPAHTDYVPSVFPDVYKKSKRKAEQSDSRFQRVQARRINKAIKEKRDKEKKQAEEEARREEKNRMDLEKEVACALSDVETGKGTQTSIAGSSIEKLREENVKLKAKVDTVSFSVSIIEGNNELTAFYTGLPTWPVFCHVFSYLSPFMPVGQSLTQMNEFFLVMTRLRLNLLFKDLSIRFQISVSLVHKIVSQWVEVMYARLRFLITWPPREIIQNNMPLIFKQLYPNCRCIIDCSELFIEMPTSFDARAKTYSNYKKHNTVKFLIGITPCGTICFLPKCWGGRASDKTITQESNFFNFIEPGDVILADHGFTIEEDIALHGGKLLIPSFTRGKAQLSQEDVECSKRLSQVRIHVERVIGLLKNKYTILQGPIPINTLKHKDDQDIANFDKLLVICAALVNLSSSIVRDKHD